MGALLLRDIMETEFDNIQNNFKRGLSKSGYTFDYDVFIDTYIKCSETLKNKELTREQIIQYLWVSFLNNTKLEHNKTKKIIKVDIEEANNIIDEPYDEQRYEICDIIINFVKTNFSAIEYNMWYSHFVLNKSYKELEKMGYKNVNFHNIFRQINSKIKNKLPEKNINYKTLINTYLKIK
jgi:hypothetical protein